MKAAQFSRYGGPEVLEIVDLPDPHPGPGQVRIVVHAAGISATDVKLRAGTLTFGAELPQTTGRDVAGVVDEVGAGVTDVAVGDRALAPGGVDAALDGAKEHGVHFSNGFVDGHAFHSLAEVGELIATGRFWLPVERTFPLAEIARARHVSEHGHVRGRLVLVIR